MAKASLGQRILGAAVILSLGFIAYSVFLQTDSGTYIDRSAQIPIQTRYIEPLDFDPPGSRGPLDREQDPLSRFSPDTEAESAGLDLAPIIDEFGKPNSWALQVGSFSTEERAKEVRDQLIEEGYKAYIQLTQMAAENQVLHRVLVGPYLGAEEVSRDQKQIDALLGLQTILLDY